MGHGMAKNIRLKIPASDVLVCYDVNPKAITQFMGEFVGSNVRAASSPKEVAELAVGDTNPRCNASDTIN